MKHNYYVCRYNNFSNTYCLYHAPAGFLVPENWERITRKEAEALARAERQRRENDPAFSGFADASIYPHDFDQDTENIYSSKFVRDGVIIWRKEA